jgi:hypothetical protein
MPHLKFLERNGSIHRISTQCNKNATDLELLNDVQAKCDSSRWLVAWAITVTLDPSQLSGRGHPLSDDICSDEIRTPEEEVNRKPQTTGQ